MVDISGYKRGADKAAETIKGCADAAARVHDAVKGLPGYLKEPENKGAFDDFIKALGGETGVPVNQGAEETANLVFKDCLDRFSPSKGRKAPQR